MANKTVFNMYNPETLARMIMTREKINGTFQNSTDTVEYTFQLHLPFSPYTVNTAKLSETEWFERLQDCFNEGYEYTKE